MAERLVAAVLLGQIAMFATGQLLVLPGVIGAGVALDAWLVWRLDHGGADDAVLARRVLATVSRHCSVHIGPILRGARRHRSVEPVTTRAA